MKLPSFLRKRPVRRENVPEDLAKVERALGYRFGDPRLLDVALTHPSCLASGVRGESNQRLEFLGDAVLELVITEALYRKFADSPEGELTNTRSSLVCARSLAAKARSLGLGEALRLDRGARSSGGADNAHNLEDAMESVIGAVYIDGGMRAAEAFVLSVFRDDLAGCRTIGAAEESPRSALQALAQGKFRCSPVYTEISREGSESNPVFTFSVSVAGRSASAQGGSKRAAQTAAAERLLAELRASGE